MNPMSEHEFIALADQYLRNELSDTQRTAFEQYCHENPSAEALLGTHQLFLSQLQAHADRAAFKQQLRQTGQQHVREIPAYTPENYSTPKIVRMWNRVRINALIAACVAIIAVFSTLWLSGYYSTIEKASSDFSALRRDMNTVKKNVHAQNAVIRSINNEHNTQSGNALGQYGATGFMVSGNGYVVTNYHVVRDADSVHLYNGKGESYKARIIYIDPAADIALLHITDSTFKKSKSIPYTFKAASSDIGEEVFTIGFPRDEPVYGQGYLSSKTGYSGDTTAYQISIPLNPGNSGGPLLDEKGNIIGIISGKQTGLDGASFAIKTDALLKCISDVPQDSLDHAVVLNKRNTLTGLSRTEQVKKIQDYVFMVKTY